MIAQMDSSMIDRHIRCPECDGEGMVQGCWVRNCKNWPVWKSLRRDNHEYAWYCDEHDKSLRFWGRLK